MRRNSFWVWACASSMLFFIACHHDHDHEHEGHDHTNEIEAAEDHEHAVGEIHFDAEQAAAVGLQVETVTPSDFKQVLKVNGEILSAEGDEHTIVATASGIVRYAEGAKLTDGAAVTHGQTLFVLSADGLAGGDAVAQALAERETAKAAFERAERLWEQKLITRTEYEAAKLRYQQVSKMNDANIKSPIQGFLKQCLVTPGSYVGEGQPLAVVTRNRKLQVHADVSARYFEALQGVSSADIIMPYSDRVYHLSELDGKLLSIGKASGLSTSSADFHGMSSTMASPYIPVIFEFNMAPGLFAGSFADVYLLSSPRHNVISVPLSSLTEEQGLFFVYIQIDDDGYRKQEVSLGQRGSERVEILKGLNPGDVVVTQGAYQVKLASVVSVAEGHHHH